VAGLPGTGVPAPAHPLAFRAGASLEQPRSPRGRLWLGGVEIAQHAHAPRAGLQDLVEAASAKASDREERHRRWPPRSARAGADGGAPRLGRRPHRASRM
jgi:hypothetical protein